MQTVTLNNGVQIPILGFGVYQIPPDQTEQAVAHALEVGYRHIDTAAAYQNEQAVGRAIKNSNIPRSDLFITTKLWIQDAPGEANTRTAFERSLERLGLDYLDLYLIHQPLGDYYSYWRAMQDLHQQGLIKAIGVSKRWKNGCVSIWLTAGVSWTLAPRSSSTTVTPRWSAASATTAPIDPALSPSETTATNTGGARLNEHHGSKPPGRVRAH
jgi:aryl-alcohol dehydrogenase-like predicted oxidoreductase